MAELENFSDGDAEASKSGKLRGRGDERRRREKGRTRCVAK